MADRFNAETRSRVMARIKNKNTAPELLLRKALWKIGVRGWRLHRKDLPGSPDLAFGRANLAVFVDGAFWHGHPSKYRPGQSGEFWDAKIARNQGRDQGVTSGLERMGWQVLRLWDFEVLNDPAAAAARVQQALTSPSLDEQPRLS